MKPATRVILQVPLDKALKQKAQAVARESGFSSLQDAIRMFLAKFTRRELIVSMTEPDEMLSLKDERRYGKIIEEIKKGKGVTKTKSLDELFSYLSA